MLVGLAMTPMLLFGTYSAVTAIDDVTVTERNGRRTTFPEGLDALSLLRAEVRSRMAAAGGAA